MKTNWKSATRVENMLNALLIVLALGALGLGAWEVKRDTGSVAATYQQQARESLRATLA